VLLKGSPIVFYLWMADGEDQSLFHRARRGPTSAGRSRDLGHRSGPEGVGPFDLVKTLTTATRTNPWRVFL